MSDAIRICEHCGSKLKLPPAAAGKAIRCPRCQGVSRPEKPTGGPSAGINKSRDGIDYRFWLTLAAGIIITLAGVMVLIASQSQKSWPTVNGTATGATLREFGIGKKYRVEVWVTWNYLVGEKSYSAEEDITKGSRITNIGEAQTLANNYGDGQEVTVFYDPSSPGTSTLAPGAKIIGAIALLGAGLLCIGIAAALRFS